MPKNANDISVYPTDRVFFRKYSLKLKPTLEEIETYLSTLLTAYFAELILQNLNLKEKYRKCL